MKEKKKPFYYGGQAVIEGVMMRGPKSFAVSVRKTNGEIVSTNENLESILGKFKFLNRPILRGTLALIDAMMLGIKALKFSADIAMEDVAEEEAKKKSENSNNGENPEVKEEKKKNNKVNDMTIGFTMVLGLLLGVGLFIFLPIVIIKPLSFEVTWYKTVLEGLVKLTLFFLYVWGISFMPDIRRVFQYHGAEHKTINAYEAGIELTPENVDKHTTVHVRCGTSFVLLVIFTSILVNMFLSWDSIIFRFIWKLALLPVVAGIAYELIRFAGGKKNFILTKILLLPGLLMQKITTKEPDREMIEVAINSLKAVLVDENEDVPEQAVAPCSS